MSKKPRIKRRAAKTDDKSKDFFDLGSGDSLEAIVSKTDQEATIVAKAKEDIQEPVVIDGNSQTTRKKRELTPPPQSPTLQFQQPKEIYNHTDVHIVEDLDFLDDVVSPESVSKPDTNVEQMEPISITNQSFESNEKAFKLKIWPNSGLGQVFDLISVKRKIPKEELILTFNGCKLFKSTNPSSVGMQDGSVVISYSKIQYEKMEQENKEKIKQLCNNDETTLVEDASYISLSIRAANFEDTIAVPTNSTTKQILNEIQKKHPEITSIYFDGEKIEDPQTITEIGIEDGDLLEIK